MIYLTEEQLKSFYGKPEAGSTSARFNADRGFRHKDKAYKYEFGMVNGHCVYAIIQKVTGSKISLTEAAALRTLSGKAEWKLKIALDPKENSKEIQAILDDYKKDLGYEYTPTKDDRFTSPLYCSHQGQRQQLVVFHPHWRVDLSQVAADPL